MNTNTQTHTHTEECGVNLDSGVNLDTIGRGGGVNVGHLFFLS